MIFHPVSESTDHSHFILSDVSVCWSLNCLVIRNFTENLNHNLQQYWFSNTSLFSVSPCLSSPSLPLPVYGSVLVYLQSGGIQSQPPPSFSCNPQNSQTPNSPFRLSVQRPAVCIRHQIQQINTQSTASTHQILHWCIRFLWVCFRTLAEVSVGQWEEMVQFIQKSVFKLMKSFIL